MAETVISSPRSWHPPKTSDSQDLIMTKTFRGDRPTLRSTGTLGFGGTVKRHVMSQEELDFVRNFFADRFMRLQDNGCRRIVTGKKFRTQSALALTRAFDPTMKGVAQVQTVTCDELLENIHHSDPVKEHLGSGQVGRRRVELLADCFGWRELVQLTLPDVTQAIEDYFDSHQEVLVGRTMLSGATAVIMRGEERCPHSPELLLADCKRKEVETWRNQKRAEAKVKLADITKLEGEIATEMAEIEELMVSPKAWTRKGQVEIAAQRRATLAKEEVKSVMQLELAAIKKDAEMDVKNVLGKMWTTAAQEEQQQYIDEFEALQEKYIEPKLGLRVRFSVLTLKHMRAAGHKDISMAPGACDAMRTTTSRWFGNLSFEGGNSPDITPGTLALEGGVGTIKFVHKEGDRVMVSWDRTGKSEWYPTGNMCKFALALCDQDEGVGTTGFGEGISTKRMFTNRIDLQPHEAAARVELRRKKHLGVGTGQVPDYGVEGEKHVGREYDRLTGTGYL